MKRIILVTLLLMPMLASAQFFDFNFGFDDPFFAPRRERKQLPKTALSLPEFKGGKEALEKYLKKNFKNPVDAEDKDGEVIIACILNTKGKVEQTAVVRSMKGPWDAEAERVCKKLKFKPAKRGKKKVKSRYDVSFPIRHGRLSYSKLTTVDV